MINTIWTTTTINDGKWHHLAYTYDGTTETVYVDGKSVGTNSISGTITSSSENIGICAEKSSSTQNFYWNGNVDEIHIYAKGLTAMELGRLYAEEKGLHIDLAQK